MNEAQRAAFLNAQTACALIEMNGMVSINIAARIQGAPMVHSGKDFTDLIDKYGIGHNAAITTLAAS